MVVHSHMPYIRIYAIYLKLVLNYRPWQHLGHGQHYQDITLYGHRYGAFQSCTDSHGPALPIGQSTDRTMQDWWTMAQAGFIFSVMPMWVT